MTSLISSFFWLFFFILLCHLVGIYLYGTGFLITSIQSQKKSQCNDPLMTNTLYAQSHPPELCWTTPLFKKTALYLVDALRFDFAFSTDYPPLFENITDPNNFRFYHNNMGVFNSLENQYPSRSSKYHFIPDPPTLTIQRVKAMTTGGVPVPIEISNTLNNPAIVEDSLIHQFKENGLRTVFEGDSLWIDLYPTQFNDVSNDTAHNISDIDSVDNICDKALQRHQNESDYDVMISHFLGIDQVGHCYVANHPSMKKKLIEINNILNRSLYSLPEDTLALVFGDHGLLEEGNHGGSTLQELDAGMFVYDNRKSRKGGRKEVEKITQIDIVPTIAIGMGIPIPYSNIGTPIRDIILGREEKLEDIQRYVNALNITTNQIIRYLKEKEGIIRETWISEIEEEIQKVQKEEIQWFENQEKLLELMNEHERISHEIHKQYVEHKSTFKFNYMLAGIIITVLSLFVSLLTLLLPKDSIVPYKSLIFGLFIGIFLGLVLVTTSNFSFYECLLMGMIICSEVCYIIGCFMSFLKVPFTLKTLTTNIPFDLLIVAVVTLIYGFGQCTDSFIKEEKYTSFYVGICSFIVLTYFNWLETKQFPITELVFCYLLSNWNYLVCQFVGYICIFSLILMFYFYKHDILLSLAMLLSCIYHLIENSSIPLLTVLIPDSIYLLSLIKMVVLIRKKDIDCLYSLIPVLSVILPLNMLITIIFFIFLIWYFKKYSFKLGVLLVFFFFGIHFFFLSGHAFQFSDIQFNAGFIGIPFYSFFGNGFLVILNTFFFPSISIIFGLLIILKSHPTGMSLYIQSSLCLTTMFIYQLVPIMFFTYFVSGHLEIFRIFTPKVCFDISFCIVTDIMIVIGYFLQKLTPKQLEEEKSYLD
ncbi:phosphatidylinositol-glycan biosynthesis class o pr [Entamoeba histolytica]|uniref:Phosphatidylinositol-glycan biosynthesis class O protein, putative n=4 Tax=Entamoeba histolytica TaxID=5759 RepID=C4LXX0_ENTH1|nr:phosphatidylinositol-glycan biosynthesis class O protein, putative [Entamoeba histolytica HM-1:IMSS]EAL50726.1 phosphatidylinositol-glycan biosynthesis class O protein, putative [Entamoeba histolytica HM-1:IMSS]GAT93624.1 phosphatidylinositol-glycan biosynthesis class o pr [Entamoeba histolytica]|eukprot:XP_656110.1 phosphatidylinositol-glycan biosynthesis class O protein, putative [Entamoeba histolytica HM-1:IMSS]